MRKNSLKGLIGALAVTVIAGAFVGCGSSTSQTPAPSNGKSGTITVAGSTALQPLADAAAKNFQTANPDANITVQGGGSGTGLTQVSSGAVEIGNSDLFAAEKLPADVAKTVVDHKVCVVSFAAVVNSKVTIDNLTKDQLVSIFTGKVTNWKEVGGPDMKIVIINRPKSSGTRATFKKQALNNQDEVEGKALTEDSSGAVKKAIETTEGSIGYLASSYTNNQANLTGIKVLKFNGIAMTQATVEDGTYPIASYEHMYTLGEATGLAKSFIDYMMSADNKALISKLGYIPTSDMKVQIK
jgi:phosphate transport system substrate-binding protein